MSSIIHPHHKTHTAFEGATANRLMSPEQPQNVNVEATTTMTGSFSERKADSQFTVSLFPSRPGPVTPTKAVRMTREDREITALTATEIVDQIRIRRLSAVRIAQAFLNRIKATHGLLNGVHQVDEARVLSEARAADRAIARGENLPRLHGLPITLKNDRQVKGFVCSKGSLSWHDETAPEQDDATLVARLKAAGAIVLGLTNVPEFLLSYEADNLVYGRTNNPHDVRRTPGGSSGGEAAVIAAGASPLGIGSDAIGSIRQPAHYAGISGIKPTHGLIPFTGNVPMDNAAAPVRDIVVHGPMARSVNDLGLVLPVIAGSDGRDARVPKTARVGDPRRVKMAPLKVAYYLHNGIVAVSSATRETVLNAVEKIRPQVASVTERAPDGIENSFKLTWERIVLGGDGGKWIKDLTQKAPVSPQCQAFIRLAEGCVMSPTQATERIREENAFKRSMDAFFDEYDVVICPVAPTPAVPHGTFHDELNYAINYSYTMPFNLSGHPAVTIPCGKSPDGMPIGIQIAAKEWHDHVALAVAERLQRQFGVPKPITPVRKENAAPIPRDSSSLLRAVLASDHKALKEILTADASWVDQGRRSDGVTPLYAACEMGDAGAVKLLLQFGANAALGAAAGSHPTPLTIARHRGHKHVATLIEKHLRESPGGSRDPGLETRRPKS